MPSSTTLAIVSADVAYIDEHKPKRARRMEGETVVAQQPAHRYLWLDASQESAFVDGGAVHTPTDFSPKGWYVQGQAAGNEPIFKVAIVNGLPVFRFAAASGQKLGVYEAGTFAIGKFGIGLSSVELFIVLRVNSVAVVNGPYQLSNAGPLEYPHVGGGSDGHLVGIFGAHGSNYDVGAPPDSLLNFHILNVATYGSPRQEDVNQNGKVIRAGAGVGAGVLQFAGSPAIGQNSGAFLDGDIAELVVWDRLLTTVERAAEKTRLANKYAIAVV